MKYLLLIYFEEREIAEDEREACYEESGRLIEDMRRNGQFLGADPLEPTAMARSVRVREGRRFVTDGPFAETREQLGGYFLVEAHDVDEAIGLAARIPMARKGTVEVRPVIELPDIPCG